LAINTNAGKENTIVYINMYILAETRAGFIPDEITASIIGININSNQIINPQTLELKKIKNITNPNATYSKVLNLNINIIVP
jgi:hypothetical protein